MTRTPSGIQIHTSATAAPVMIIEAVGTRPSARVRGASTSARRRAQPGVWIDSDGG